MVATQALDFTSETGAAAACLPPAGTASRWDLAAARKIYELPITELLFRAQQVHRERHDPSRVQLCRLLSIKTGRCPEDCSYCPQSAHHGRVVEPEKLLDLATVRERAQAAKDEGATRFCMGAAWRNVRDGEAFDRVLDMVRLVRDMGMEACCTLGMVTPAQAERLAEAGLTAYNHNLDTGPDYYDKIITTRTYQDRLDTAATVQAAGIQLCCGGIVGMGESVDDRLAMLVTLAQMETPPESVPINALVAVKGTPLQDQPPVDPIELVRIIATARIMLPVARVRLSAGRENMDVSTQALCFMAGANSIFVGDKLLTTPNPSKASDATMLAQLGLVPEETPTATGESAGGCAGRVAN